MLRLIMRTLCTTTVVLTASFALAQAEFSAEIVNNQRPDSHEKIYMAKDKIRIETGDKDPRSGGVVIANMTTRTSIVLMEQQHMYMEMPAAMASQRDPYKFFRAGDVDNACPDWLAMSWNKGATCHKVGSETVNGRSTVKYEGTNSKGDSGTVWLDSKLRFPVKWQEKSGGFELRNIQEGTQPASLFEVPAGYTKFDMGAMTRNPK